MKFIDITYSDKIPENSLLIVAHKERGLPDVRLIKDIGVPRLTFREKINMLPLERKLWENSPNST